MADFVSILKSTTPTRVGSMHNPQMRYHDIADESKFSTQVLMQIDFTFICQRAVLIVDDRICGPSPPDHHLCARCGVHAVFR